MSNCQNCGKLRENYPANTNNYYFNNLQKNVYSENAQPYHAAPYPMQRTTFDLNMIKAFCENCGPGFCPESVKNQPTEPANPWNDHGGATWNSLNEMIMSDTKSTGNQLHATKVVAPAFSKTVPYY